MTVEIHLREKHPEPTFEETLQEISEKKFLANWT